MSHLTDPMLGEVARRAGFVGDDLTTAIAVSIAASGGNPGYDHAIWPGPVAHYKGLYGACVVQWPGIADLDLDSPWAAANVAYELTKRYGWGWNPTARAGTHRHYLDRGAAAAAMLPYHEQAAEPIMIGAHAASIDHEFQRIAANAVAIDHGWSH